MRSRVAARCGRIVESSWFDPLMLGIIAVNALTLGLETYDSIDAAIGDQLRVANGVILGLFVVELLIRMGAFNLFIGIVINSMEEARAIELHRAEKELLEEDDEDHEKAHKVVLEERLRTLRAAVEELEREVRTQRH